MSNRILVTGSTGKVGVQVVEQLAKANANVLAAVQSMGRADVVKKLGATPVVINFSSAATILPSLDGVDKLFLLTPLIPEQVEWSASVVNAAKLAGVRHLVKLSAMGVGWPQIPLFGSAHAEMEQHILKSGVPYTFLRPTFFMQNLLGEASIKSQGVWYGSDDDGRASHIDTRDIAAVGVAALTKDSHEGKAYELTGSTLRTNAEVASLLSKVVGKEVRYVNLSDDQIRGAMKEGGVPEWLIEPLLDLAKNHREGKFEVVRSSVEEINGRKPIELEQFFSENINAFK